MRAGKCGRFLLRWCPVVLAVVLPVEIVAHTQKDGEARDELGTELKVLVRDHGAELGRVLALLVREATADVEHALVRRLAHEVSHLVAVFALPLLVPDDDRLLVKERLDLQELLGARVLVRRVRLAQHEAFAAHVLHLCQDAFQVSLSLALDMAHNPCVRSLCFDV